MRLTKKFRNIYVYNFDKNCDFEERKERSIETHNKIIDKCGQLEDIEDELGIDLITLFKAVKNGIYVWFEGRIGENLLISFKDKAIIHIHKPIPKVFFPEVQTFQDKHRHLPFRLYRYFLP